MADTESSVKTGILWPHKPYFSSHENPALERVRTDIAKSRHPQPSHREVENMHDFLWRMSSSYTYRPYSYYENHHAFRVLSRWLRIYGLREI